MECDSPKMNRFIPAAAGEPTDDFILTVITTAAISPLLTPLSSMMREISKPGVASYPTSKG